MVGIENKYIYLNMYTRVQHYWLTCTLCLWLNNICDVVHSNTVTPFHILLLKYIDYIDLLTDYSTGLTY